MSGYKYRGNNFTIENEPMRARRGRPRKQRPQQKPERPTYPETCTAPNCDRTHEAKGYCTLHYQRLKTTGTINPRHAPTFEQRFWDKVNKTETCWLWTASKTSTGYGQIGRNRQTHYANKIAYEWANGPLPAGATLKTTCPNRECVNPDHHTPTTQHTHTKHLELAA